MKKRLGEILLERGLIDVDQLNSALAHQRQWGMRLGTALVAKGFIAEGMLTRVLSESLGIPMVDLARVVVDQHALQIVPRRLAEQYDVFPIADTSSTRWPRYAMRPCSTSTHLASFASLLVRWPTSPASNASCMMQ